MQKLKVYFNHYLAGTLIQEDRVLGYTFQYDEGYLKTDQPALSISLPKQIDVFSAYISAAFFAGFLPEESNRDHLAKCLKINPTDTWTLLKVMGRECAGAISIVEEDQKVVLEYKPEYKFISDDEFDDILRHLHQRPLNFGYEGTYFSIAGAQTKMGVALVDDRIAIPLKQTPTTHIIKNKNLRFKNSVENEFYCMRLAKEIGLEVANVEMRKVMDERYLLIERFDRKFFDDKIIRIHQEDFCQAMGIPSEKKYELSEGPGFKKVKDYIYDYSVDPIEDSQKLIKAIAFNYFVGNCDAHGKNYSFVYNDGIRLAPLYDLLSTAVYPHLKPHRLAMTIGGQKDLFSVSNSHWRKLAEDLNVNYSLLKEIVYQIEDNLMQNHLKLAESFQADIKLRNVIRQIDAVITKQTKRLKRELI